MIYTDTCANNKEISTATVTVTGTGNYTGTAQITFAIVDCAHQCDEERGTTSAAGTEVDEQTRTYSSYSETETGAIPATGHRLRQPGPATSPATGTPARSAVTVRARRRTVGNG